MLGDNSTSCGPYKFATAVRSACGWAYNAYEEPSAAECEEAPEAGELCCEDKKAYFDYCLGGGEVNATKMASAQSYYDGMNVLKGGVFHEGDMSAAGAGWIALAMSLFILCAALYVIIKLLQKLVRGSAEKVLKRAFNMNDYVAILVGAAITICVQSSSITTSTLTPLVAVGVLSLEKMLPLTLGANIGTTCTALLAATVSGKAEAVQVALCHLFFNIFGILVWYPVPMMRALPLNGARWLGRMAAAYKTFPIVYTLLAFIVYPLIMLGDFVLIMEDGAGAVVAGVLILLLFLAAHGALVFWWKRKGGREIVNSTIEKRIAANSVVPV